MSWALVAGCDEAEGAVGAAGGPAGLGGVGGQGVGEGLGCLG